jgi:predicted hydrolase (HD superfamily)
MPTNKPAAARGCEEFLDFLDSISGLQLAAKLVRPEKQRS